MKSNRKWKMMLGYLSGCLILAGVMVLAWFVPGWYSGWKDEQRIGQVTLMNRENIQFIDTERLDFVGRLKLLQSSGTPYSHMEWSEGGYVSTTEEMWRSRIGQWVEAGLLPKEVENVLDTWSIWIWEQYQVSPNDQGYLQVELLQFRSSEDYSDGAMTFVVDAENGIPYYVSVSGPYFWDALAEESGYSSFTELRKAVADGDYWELSEDIISGYGPKFASAVGADLAEAFTGAAALDLEITLYYDEFAGYACRRTVDSNTGFGIAYMFGNRGWGDFVSEVLERTVYSEKNAGEYGEYERVLQAGEWADMLRATENLNTAYDSES